MVYFSFFLFFRHPRNYYKLSQRLLVTFSNTCSRCGKILECIWPATYAIDQVHRSWGSLFLNLRDVLAFLMRLVVSMLGCFISLSAYLWLSFLTSFLTYDTLKSWYNISLVVSRSVKYLFWNLYNISMFELECPTNGYHIKQSSK